MLIWKNTEIYLNLKIILLLSLLGHVLVYAVRYEGEWWAGQGCQLVNESPGRYLWKVSNFPYERSLKIRAWEGDWWHKLCRSIFLNMPVLVFVRADWTQDQFLSWGLEVLFLSFIEKAVFWRSRNISGMFMEKRIIPRTPRELWQVTHKSQVSKLQLKAFVC